MTLRRKTETQPTEGRRDDGDFAREELDGSVIANNVLTNYVMAMNTLPNNGFDVMERADAHDHALRVARIVHTFADDLIAPATYHAAILHDLADRIDGGFDDDELHRVKATVAAESLFDYFTSPHIDQNDRDFTKSLLAEMVGIEEAAEKTRQAMSVVATDEVVSDIMLGFRKGCIDDPAIWKAELPMVDIEHLATQALSNNIESIIIKAAEAIDNLEHPAPHDTALLQDILEAETFYAPLCEIWGLDAMAMKLRSEATKRRYEKRGEKALLERAKQIQDDALQCGIDQRVQDFIGKDARVVYDYAPNSDWSGEHSLFMSGAVEGGRYDGAEIRIRIKSIGSIAKKIETDRLGRAPLDIIGMTIVSDDYAMSATRFRSAIEAVIESDAMRLEPAPSKHSPVYVQGNPEYVKQMVYETPIYTTPGIESVSLDPVTTPHPYRVAKITGRYATSSVPFEVQFLAGEDKKSARIGMQAHIIYKLRKYAEKYLESGSDDYPDYQKIVSLLESIYERRVMIDRSARNVNAANPERADAFYARVEELYTAGEQLLA